VLQTLHQANALGVQDIKLTVNAHWSSNLLPRLTSLAILRRTYLCLPFALSLLLRLVESIAAAANAVYSRPQYHVQLSARVCSGCPKQNPMQNICMTCLAPLSLGRAVDFRLYSSSWVGMQSRPLLSALGYNMPTTLDWARMIFTFPKTYRTWFSASCN
jgi:hypothetical protein